LYALHLGGSVPVTSDAYRRGVRYLLRTQDEDGSWLVTKRAIPANTYLDGGFPHGESQYSSYNATCWATNGAPARSPAPAADPRRGPNRQHTLRTLMNPVADNNTRAVLVRSVGEARTLEMLGVRITLLVTAEDTGGAWSLLEYTAPPRFPGPAPHYHERTSELFHVLDGELTMRLGTTRANAGARARRPCPRPARRGPRVPQRHGQPVRFLIQFTPGGPENYFVELADLIRSEPSWPPADMRPVAELAARPRHRFRRSLKKKENSHETNISAARVCSPPARRRWPPFSRRFPFLPPRKTNGTWSAPKCPNLPMSGSPAARTAPPARATLPSSPTRCKASPERTTAR
jgi:mannose-6-phosphate isomerase-like protein (cupin superfamily)